MAGGQLAEGVAADSAHALAVGHILLQQGLVVDILVDHLVEDGGGEGIAASGGFTLRGPLSGQGRQLLPGRVRRRAQQRLQLVDIVGIAAQGLEQAPAVLLLQGQLIQLVDKLRGLARLLPGPDAETAAGRRRGR